MRSLSCDPAPAHSAPCDHVRGDLVAPAIDWLGQLLIERGRPLATLDARIGGGDRALLLDPPGADAWVPVTTGQRIVEAVVDVHGGRMPAVLRELGRRSVPQIAALSNAPTERLGIELDRLIRLGHWRRPRLGLPGDLLELEARRPCSATLVGWISGLLTGATKTGRRGTTHVAARIESPEHIVFVRCAA
jgi:hypothetical protein